MMSFWVVPWSCSAGRALFVRRRDIERHQPWRRGVDGHRGVHRGERNFLEQGPHVANVRNRDPDLADLAARQRVVAVEAGLGGQIERDRQSRLAFCEILGDKADSIRERSSDRRKCGRSKVCPAAPPFACPFASAIALLPRRLAGIFPLALPSALTGLSHARQRFCAQHNRRKRSERATFLIQSRRCRKVVSWP